MLRVILRVCTGLVIAGLNAGAMELDSPNGKVRVCVVTEADNHLQYCVLMNGRPVLQTAPAGVIIDGIDIGAGVKLGKPERKRIHESFDWRGNKTAGTNDCMVHEVPVHCEAARLDWVFEVRVFNDGAAFRYRVPGQGARQVGGEPTLWRLPEDCTVWFQTNTANYEGVYQSARAGQLPVAKEGAKRAIHLGPPVTAVLQDGTLVMLSEAGLYQYSGLTFRPKGGGVLAAAFEDDPNGWAHEGELRSPWRVIVLARDLDGLVNSDIIPALCEPPDPKLFPQGPNTSWLRPGKAPCTWMVFGNDGAQWDKQKWWVDVSAAMGCEYLLVDAGWRTERWGWLKNGGDLWGRAAELCRYAAERQMGIILWHAFPEGRDDGPGLTTVEAREELFKNCEKAGVKGVKIDFFDSESKTVIDAYEDLLRRSAQHRLMINFHGANKPTGEARTWPNEVSREGIREQEYVLWDALPLSHYGALPFTRMVAGHGDFLPGYVQKRFLKNTTLIFQLASVVVFSSPFLCWPDNPEAYLGSPLLQFVRTVPVTWDQTQVLPGSAIGELVVMARRKGAEYYVAVLNCRPEARTLEVVLPFDLAGKEMTLYQDGPRGSGCRIESGLKPPESGKLSVSVQPGGGLVARLAPAPKHAGWK